MNKKNESAMKIDFFIYFVDMKDLNGFVFVRTMNFCFYFVCKKHSPHFPRRKRCGEWNVLQHIQNCQLSIVHCQFFLTCTRRVGSRCVLR